MKEYFHPYVSEDKKFSFYFTKTSTTETQIKLWYHGNKKAENTCKFFELEEIYKYHNDISDKAEEKRHEFDNECIEDIKKILNNAGIMVSKKRMLDIIYDYYIVENPLKVFLKVEAFFFNSASSCSLLMYKFQIKMQLICKFP